MRRYYYDIEHPWQREEAMPVTVTMHNHTRTRTMSIAPVSAAVNRLDRLITIELRDRDEVEAHITMDFLNASRLVDVLQDALRSLPLEQMSRLTWLRTHHSD